MTRPTEPVSIGGITFDALLDSDESWESDAPSYPVEDGFEVGDSIIIRPLTLSMNVYLTNTPVTWKEAHGAGPHRVQDVIGRLREMYFKRELVEVRTPDGDYGDMAIVSIGLPKSAETGAARLIPISLRQVTATKLRTAEIPAGYRRGGATGHNAGVAGVSMSPLPSLPSLDSLLPGGGDGGRGSVLYNLAGDSGLLDGLLGRLGL